jgi:hypothetical protein
MKKLLVGLLMFGSITSFAQVINGVKYENTPSMKKTYELVEAPTTILRSEKELIKLCESSEQMEDFKRLAEEKNLNVLEVYCTYGDTFRTLVKKGTEGAIAIKRPETFGLTKFYTSKTTYYLFMNLLYSDARK